MTPGGWLFLGVSWLVILGLLGFCYYNAFFRKMK